MRVRRIVHTMCGVVLLGVLATSSIGAIPDARRTTYFTFSAPFSLPGVTLAPGAYVFEVLNPDTGGHVVRVMNRNRTKLYALQITRHIQRTRARALPATVTFGEAPAGSPPPIRTWFPVGETIGREFIY